MEVKTIFWWEYVHRLWGRLIGLVFALPLAWFAVTGRVRGALLSVVASSREGGASGAHGGKRGGVLRRPREWAVAVSRPPCRP